MVDKDKSQVPARRGRVWPTMLLGAAILLSGAAAGLGIAMLLLRESASRPGDRPRWTATEIAARIAARCDLNEEQTKQVEKIMADRLGRLRAIREEMSERVVAEHEQLCGEMKAVLTPEQFERWNTRFEAVRKRARLFRPRHGSGPFGRRRDARGPLERFDANKDGKLTKDEVPEPLWDRLSRADADGDGALTEQELNKRQGGRPRDEGPR